MTPAHPHLRLVTGGLDFPRPMGAKPPPKVLEEAPVLACRQCRAALWAYRQDGKIITHEHACVRPPVPLARCSLCDAVVPAVATWNGAVRVDPHVCGRGKRGFGWAAAAVIALALWACGLAAWRAIS